MSWASSTITRSRQQLSSNQTRVKCDVAGITAHIEQVGKRAVRGISDAMHYYAEAILRDAIANAPHDTGSLENALEVEYGYGGINGRLQVTIRVNPDAPYIDTNPDHKASNKTVGDYAELMERHLRPWGRDGEDRWRAREGTTSKGPQAGGRFLARAVRDHKEALLNRARKIVERAAKS